VLALGIGRDWWMYAWSFAGVAAVGGVCLSVGACRPKASATQCDKLLDRYAQLVVIEKFPDASDDLVRLERERERNEARADDAFKNCSSEVSQKEFDCAMGAPNANSFEKCLE
jgi:hypothetical protein